MGCMKENMHPTAWVTGGPEVRQGVIARLAQTRFWNRHSFHRLVTQSGGKRKGRTKMIRTFTVAAFATLLLCGCKGAIHGGGTFEMPGIKGSIYWDQQPAATTQP
jgi:hypothetical protein